MSIQSFTTDGRGPMFIPELSSYSNWSTKDVKYGTEQQLAASRPQARYQGADSIAFDPSLTAPSSAPYAGDRGALKVESRRNSQYTKMIVVGGSILLILLYFKLSK